MNYICSCRKHAKSASTTIGEHTFYRYTKKENAAGLTFYKWMWSCSCGAVGKWQYQSDSVTYHQWLDHVKRRGK